DPHLRTIQNHMISRVLEVRQHARWIAAVVRLCETKASQPLSTRKLWKIFLTLLFAAVCIDRIHHERTLHRRSRTHAAVATLELLHHQAITGVIESATAVFRRNRWTETTQITQLLHNLLRKLSLLCIVFNDRRNLLLHIIAHHFTYVALLLGEQFIDIKIIGTCEIIRACSHCSILSKCTVNWLIR